jgi:hypothetical protein
VIEPATDPTPHTCRRYQPGAVLGRRPGRPGDPCGWDRRDGPSSAVTDAALAAVSFDAGFGLQQQGTSSPVSQPANMVDPPGTARSQMTLDVRAQGVHACHLSLQPRATHVTGAEVNRSGYTDGEADSRCGGRQRRASSRNRKPRARPRPRRSHHLGGNGAPTRYPPITPSDVHQ